MVRIIRNWDEIPAICGEKMAFGVENVVQPLTLKEETAKRIGFESVGFVCPACQQADRIK